jgi:hypothetical protein
MPMWCWFPLLVARALAPEVGAVGSAEEGDKGAAGGGWVTRAQPTIARLTWTCPALGEGG